MRITSRRPRSLRPALDALEHRDLMTAYAGLSAPIARPTLASGSGYVSILFPVFRPITVDLQRPDRIGPIGPKV